MARPVTCPTVRRGHRSGRSRASRTVIPFVIALLLAVTADRAAAQNATVEADVTVGHSTQAVDAAATQVRGYGALARGWRYYGDVTWAARRGEESDAFGAAYPYEPELQLMEAYVERTAVRGRRLFGVRLGRYRTPFGLYGRSDHGYTGFVRAPMVRYSDYWTISNNYLETGANVVAGLTWLSVEGSLGVATDADEFARPHTVDAVVRVQTAGASWMVGASHLRSRPSPAWGFAHGRNVFSGIDGRWMRGGVMVRGEWLAGQPFDEGRTRGGYVDVLLHRPAMGPVTAVARVERLDYDAGPFSRYPRRYSAGTKIRVARWLSAQTNFVHQPMDRTGAHGHTSFDVALTFTVRAHP